MRGIVYTGGNAMVTDKLEVADPGPKEVKVKIMAAGVCYWRRRRPRREGTA